MHLHVDWFESLLQLQAQCKCLVGGAKRVIFEKAYNFVRHSIRRTIFFPPEDHLSWFPVTLLSDHAASTSLGRLLPEDILLI
jgi:hypothetical protein